MNEIITGENDITDQPKTVKKINYSANFEKFWNVYPRRVGKLKAYTSWKTHVGENELASLVVDHIKKRNRLRFWHQDKAKIPMPATFLNQHRWEDEDWEDEIKTRGKENLATYTPMPMPTVNIEAPKLNGWAMMANRLLRSYIFKSRGLTSVQLAKCVRTKNKIVADFIPAIQEELSTASSVEDAKKIKEEMAMTMAQTLLSSFDYDTGLLFGPDIINNQRRKQ